MNYEETNNANKRLFEALDNLDFESAQKEQDFLYGNYFKKYQNLLEIKKKIESWKFDLYKDNLDRRYQRLTNKVNKLIESAKKILEQSAEAGIKISNLKSDRGGL